MKAVIAAAIVALLPAPALAQSLPDTHELVWHPSGKSPAMTYRLRAKPSCQAQIDRHQSGKGALPAPRKCVAAVIKKTPAES